MAGTSSLPRTILLMYIPLWRARPSHSSSARRGPSSVRKALPQSLRRSPPTPQRCPARPHRRLLSTGLRVKGRARQSGFLLAHATVKQSSRCAPLDPHVIHIGGGGVGCCCKTIPGNKISRYGRRGVCGGVMGMRCSKTRGPEEKGCLLCS